MSIQLDDFLDCTRGFSVQGVSVVQDGAELAHYEAPGGTVGNIYSGTKSFTSAAAGIAAAEGLLSMDERVVDCFPEELPAKVCGELKELRLEQLLTMSPGIGRPLLLGESRVALRKTEPDWVRFCLRQPFSDAPGTRFLYTNAGPYLMSVLIERRCGMTLPEYLAPRLLEPLRIELSGWESCPAGHCFGASGFEMDLNAFSRFGQLYLQNGRWEGRQLLSEEWVRRSGEAHISIRESGEFGTGYGRCFWTMPDGAFRAEGKYEQYCVILPRKNAVVTVKAMNETVLHDRPVLRALMKTVIDRL